MKSILKVICVLLLMVVAAPAWSGSAVHMLNCEQDDDFSDEQVEAMAAEWFKAAKSTEGGKNLKLYLEFPVAAKAGETDLTVVLVAPSFTEWGTFMDNYPGSAAEKIDEKYEDDLDCSDGTLWESVEVE